MRDLKGWVWMGLAVALIVAIAAHEPMVIVFAFAGLGFSILCFALWLLRELMRRPSPKASGGRSGKGRG